MTVKLTSFREAESMNPQLWVRWSAARWEPQQATYWPKAKWAAPVRPDGSAIKLRDFGDEPLPKYHEYMLSLYRSRWQEIRDWIYRYGGENNVLACWCPYTKVAASQLEQFGTFHCHLGVVAEVLSAAGVETIYGARHQKEMVR